MDPLSGNFLEKGPENNRSNGHQVVRVEVVEVDGEVLIQVVGTAASNDLNKYEIQLSKGENPSKWETVFDEDDNVVNGVVVKFPTSVLTDVGKWTVRLVVKDDHGRVKEARGSIDVG